eukprot:2080600-Prymnesium_polylepis.6
MVCQEIRSEHSLVEIGHRDTYASRSHRHYHQLAPNRSCWQQLRPRLTGKPERGNSRPVAQSRGQEWPTCTHQSVHVGPRCAERAG